MANFYIMKCMAAGGPLHFTIESAWRSKGPWKMGHLFSRDDKDKDFQPPTDVIPLETKIDSKAAERIYPELTWHPLPLMSRRLVAALESAGVNNLQTYPTTITNPQGDTPADYYIAVNIVGLVAAADLTKSQTSLESEERILSVDFHSLTVDPQKARDALMFRLAENISAVLVHERVRAHVEAQGITTLTWFEPEEWAG
jgi:hypothetical protein